MLPAMSVCLAVRVWLPPVSVELVIDQLPEPSAVAVPRTVVPLVSNSVTVAPASAPLPVKVGVVTLVMLSVLDEPVSVAAVRSGADGAAAPRCRSSPKGRPRPHWCCRQCRSAWRSGCGCRADSVELVIDQLPEPSAVAVPSTVVPLVSNSVTVAPASAPLPVKVGVRHAGDVVGAGRTGSRSPPSGPAPTAPPAVVSSVKLSAAVPMLLNASVWLATMVCAPSASPVGVNDQAPRSIGGYCGGDESAIDRKASTVVLARPVPVSASFEVILSLADAPVSNARLSVTVGPVVLSVKTTGRTGAGITGGVGILGHDAVAAIARQRDARAPAAVVLHERGAGSRRAAIVEQRHRGSGFAGSGNRLRGLIDRTRSALVMATAGALRCRSSPQARPRPRCVAGRVGLLGGQGVAAGPQRRTGDRPVARASAVAVPSTVVPSVSYSVTVAPASAPLPVNVGVASLVRLSVLDDAAYPTHGQVRRDGAAAAMVSIVTASAAEAALTLPATSVCLAVRV